MSVNKITWLGHASTRIEGEKVIYVDPWKLGVDHPPADIILITHSHYDHCSRADVDRIRREETLIFAPPDCARELPPDFRRVSPGWEEEAGGVRLRAVPAYNLNKEFHPRSNQWVGYLITLGGETIYQSGDTDYIPEMKDIKADIVILPVGGTYTMNASEAAEAVNQIEPKLAIPIHFGSIVGSRRDAEEFKRLCRFPVEILPAAV